MNKIEKCIESDKKFLNFYLLDREKHFSVTTLFDNKCWKHFYKSNIINKILFFRFRWHFSAQNQIFLCLFWWDICVNPMNESQSHWIFAENKNSLISFSIVFLKSLNSNINYYLFIWNWITINSLSFSIELLICN